MKTKVFPGRVAFIYYHTIIPRSALKSKAVDTGERVINRLYLPGLI